MYKCERRSSPRRQRELIFMAKVESVYRLRRFLSRAIKFVEFSATEPSVCIYGALEEEKDSAARGLDAARRLEFH